MTAFPNLDGLRRLTDEQQRRRATPKYQIPTRLEEKTADEKNEDKAEKAWRKACIKRDGKICKCCGRKVEQKIDLAPDRLEVHHVAGRADRAVRWDVRNGIVLCFECHDKITKHRLHIVQVARHLFRVKQKTYINAKKPLAFKEAA